MRSKDKARLPRCQASGREVRIVHHREGENQHEVRTLRETRYRGRPLALLTAAQRQELGRKISEGLCRYYARWRV